jgi:ABC-type multidrug transport system fused ATPase/permease subunit
VAAPTTQDVPRRALRRAASDQGQVIGYCWRANRAATIGVLIFPLAVGSLPLLQTVFNGLLVGAIPAAIDAGGGSRAAGRATDLLVIVAALVMASTVVGQANGLLTAYLGPRFALEARRGVTDSVSAPAGIAHLEDPALADEISFVLAPERDWVWRAALDFGQSVFMSWAQGAAYVVLLGSFVWWLPLVAAPAWILDWKNGADYATGNLFGGQQAAAGVRRARYLKQVAAGPASAKETRAFGLAAWTVDRFRRQWADAMQPVWASNRRGLPTLVGASVAKIVGGVVIFWLLADAALAGRISLAAIAIYAPAGLRLLQLGYFGDANTYFSQATNLTGRARDLERRLGSLDSAPGQSPALGLPRTEIRFDSVTFSYPGTSERILDGLDLTIEQGKSLAVVGENGAGKTTLIKLLCRLYEPTGGQILVDGVPLTELEVGSWRSRLGVIFQDFVRWELPLRDNLTFGSSDVDTELLEGALADAGGGDLLADVPDRLQTILSRGFEGGTDLSGGQWQKVALARALASVRRGAGLLVLDEPTASLDVRAEAAVFEQLLTAVRGVTTILVSHRFNTVRRADRIAVIADGRVVEEGSHAELMAAGGRYATMYRLQADRFLDGDTMSEHLGSRDA